MAGGRDLTRPARLGLVAMVVMVGAGAFAVGPPGTEPLYRSRAVAGAGAPSGPAEPAGPAGLAAAPLEPAAVVAEELPPDQELPADPPVAPEPACGTGDGQLAVEVYLGQVGSFGPVTVDGVQSVADCAAIRRFQHRYGIKPVTGRAADITSDVVRRLAASMRPESWASCGAAATGVTACVDLTLQTMWVLRDGAVVFGPTIVRTGAPGMATPPGAYDLNYRNPREWSWEYQVWLPYWQNFNAGVGFHESVTYLHNPALGSHGCVNLLHRDAVSLWNTTPIGATVRLFGHRPGT